MSRGTNCLGDHLSMGTKWAGTVCSWGPIVGDQMSGDWMGSGPNEKQPLRNCLLKMNGLYFSIWDRKYQPFFFLLLLSDQNQNSGFGRILLAPSSLRGIYPFCLQKPKLALFSFGGAKVPRGQWLLLPRSGYGFQHLKWGKCFLKVHFTKYFEKVSSEIQKFNISY